MFNNNRRSTLSAVLLCFIVNFIGEIFALTARAEVFYTMLWVVAAVLIALLWGPETLTREGATVGAKSRAVAGGRIGRQSPLAF